MSRSLNEVASPAAWRKEPMCRTTDADKYEASNFKLHRPDNIQAPGSN
jgi:hypothetical protein